jgi:hypothetical protein
MGEPSNFEKWSAFNEQFMRDVHGIPPKTVSPVVIMRSKIGEILKYVADTPVPDRDKLIKDLTDILTE